LRRRVLQGGHDAAEDQLGKGGCYLAMHLPIGLHVLPHRVLLLAALEPAGRMIRITTGSPHRLE